MLLRILLLLALLGNVVTTFAQPKTPADFGYRHLRMRYQRDTVDILVLSKKGEELKRKPVFLFVQGSLPVPLIKIGEKGPYGVFPFATTDFLPDFHLVIISKPGVPLVAETKNLKPGFIYTDPKTGQSPATYCQHDYLEYYVARNQQVLRYLARQPWVEAHNISAMGHSAGSTVVARMARHPGPLRRALYLSGNPLGRMLTIVLQDRAAADSASAESEFDYWRQVVGAPQAYSCNTGDSNLTTASFSQSQNPLQDFLHTRIPVFVGYGTRDWGAPAADYLRLETIRAKKVNFTFRAYPGLEHNFFGFTNGQIDYDKFNWDRVAHEFFAWIKTH
jgi:dienelactone hydrolase